MTNAEKYLKDGVDIKELSRELCEFIKENYGFIVGNEYMLKEFWERSVKPTLTEDERAILRNFKECYKYIGREGMLYVGTHEKDSKFVSQVVIDEYKPNLFQFIKEEEEYSIEELLK